MASGLASYSLRCSFSPQVTSLSTSKGARMTESVESGHTAHDLSSIVSGELELNKEASVRMDSQVHCDIMRRAALPDPFSYI